MGAFKMTEPLKPAPPGPGPSSLKSSWKKLRTFHQSIWDGVAFRRWLREQHARHRKKIVIVCRSGALGDIVCTLPLCSELRKRHPNALLVFLTHYDYQKMVLLSRAADEVYGAKAWTWPFSLSPRYRLPGIVEAIYNPKTTDELSPKNGAPLHLVDDFAASCQVTIPEPERQPRLFPPPEFIKQTQITYGLADDLAKGRLIIGINCGRTWPVRMWDATKWQELIDKIHTNFDAAVLQFGLTLGKDDVYEQLRGVHFLANRLKSDELVALIAGCHLVISIDSGPVHMAGAVGVPVVGLFGAVNPLYRLPPGSPAAGVFSNVPCLYCHHKTPRGHWQTGCPNDIRCMKELEVQTVFEAVKTMLAKSGKTS
jgi:ADP-heptose:LPS heptosyltransferase